MSSSDNLESRLFYTFSFAMRAAARSSKAFSVVKHIPAHKALGGD